MTKIYWRNFSEKFIEKHQKLDELFNKSRVVYKTSVWNNLKINQSDIFEQQLKPKSRFNWRMFYI